MNMIKIAYATLGCKVNKYDTDSMRELMEEAGYETVEFDQIANVYVINTCTVTGTADKKSRQLIARARARNSEAIICVCGCLAERAAENILQIDGVSAVVGTLNRRALLGVVERALSGEVKINAVGEIQGEELKVTHSPDRTRANIKLCDGCDSFCSYCIIPYARGRVRSRALEDIREESNSLVKSGIREAVLTGIHIASYGKDLQDVALIDAIRAVNDSGMERIRLGSLEPRILTDEFCKSLSSFNRLCPHFHISLQSGSKSVLKRMNRKYTPEEYIQCVDNVRKYFDKPAITTDIICGFPGETEEEHLETMEFLEKLELARAHVFPFSEREGTPAAAMSDPVDMSVRKRRAEEVSTLARSSELEYLRSLLQTTEKVLFEEPTSKGFHMGHGERYIMVKAKGVQAGNIARVRLVELSGFTLIGDLI